MSAAMERTIIIIFKRVVARIDGATIATTQRDTGNLFLDHRALRRDVIIHRARVYFGGTSLLRKVKAFCAPRVVLRRRKSWTQREAARCGISFANSLLNSLSRLLLENVHRKDHGSKGDVQIRSSLVNFLSSWNPERYFIHIFFSLLVQSKKNILKK